MRLQGKNWKTFFMRPLGKKNFIDAPLGKIKKKQIFYGKINFENLEFLLKTT